MDEMKTQKNTIRRRMGFTLIELQMATAIACIALLTAVSIYIFYRKTYVIGSAVLDVYASSRVAMGWVAKDVRCAAQVVSSYTSGTTYTTGDHAIVLQVPSIDTSGNVIKSYYDYIIYQLQGAQLYRIIIIDPKFNTAGDPKYHQNGRQNENRTVAGNCVSLTFSSGGIALSGIANKSTINTVAIYLPLNKTISSLSGVGTHTASINPTTIVRLRNK